MKNYKKVVGKIGFGIGVILILGALIISGLTLFEIIEQGKQCNSTDLRSINNCNSFKSSAWTHLDVILILFIGIRWCRKIIKEFKHKKLKRHTFLISILLLIIWVIFTLIRFITNLSSDPAIGALDYSLNIEDYYIT